MKVVQINGVSNVGSTGKIVTQLSDVMDSQGIENYIIAAGYKEKKKKDNVFFCNSYLGVRLHQVLGTVLGNSGFHSFFATRKAISVLKKIKPDVVHLHNIYGYFLNVEKVLKYLKASNIQTIYTTHDFWPITGHCTHFVQAGCYRWKEQCGNCPQLRKFPYSRFFDRTTALLNKKRAIFKDWDRLHLAAASQWAISYLPESIMGGDREFRVIANGIDTSAFKPVPVERPEELKDKYIILSVAMAWGPNKGYNDLLQLSSKLAEDEVLMLIGLPEEKMKGLPKNVIGMGRTKNTEELCRYYNMADVYVTASLEETMGLTVVESMACGTPAIVYNKTALPELIEDGCGYVCDEVTPESMYAAIQKVRKTGKEAYSQRCIEYAVENFDKWGQYRKYCDYYRDTLRQKVDAK